MSSPRFFSRIAKAAKFAVILAAVAVGIFSLHYDFDKRWSEIAVGGVLILGFLFVFFFGINWLRAKARSKRGDE